jgi:hypothetical protein
MSDESPTDHGGKTLALVPGIELAIRPEDTGAKILVTEEGSNAVYSATHERDFYSSPQKRRTIANEIKRNVSESFDGDTVAEAFRDVCTELDAAHDEIAAALRAPTVEKLVEETVAVKYYRAGSNSYVTVHLAADGRKASIEFSMGEWAHGGIGTLEEQYVAAFFPAEVDVTSEHWEQLKEEWREMAEEIDGDDYDPIDVIADSVIEKLRERIGVPFEDEEALERGKYNAVHKADPAASLDTTGPVLWVTGSALSDMVSDVASHNVHPDVVKTLREQGVLTGSQKRVGNKRAYPFDPDAFDYDPDALADVSEDDPDDLVGGEL